MNVGSSDGQRVLRWVGKRESIGSERGLDAVSGQFVAWSMA